MPRRLTLTSEGKSMLASLVPGIQVVQQSLLGLLDEAEQTEFLRLLRKFVLLNELSRAPLRRTGIPEPGFHEPPTEIGW
jgi:MarR family transcriptional regulator, temperature-dependent positive regulator of motility